MLRWIQQVITPITVISTIPFLLALMIGSYLSHRYNSILRDNRDLVVHTYQVIATIDDLFIVIEDAETGQRGFIITGEPAYLEPYQAALQTVPRSLAALRVLVADSPKQIEQVAALEVALDRKLDELGATIALRHSEGFEAARSSIIANDGKIVMDAIRRIVAQMSATERALLEARTARVSVDERNIIIVAILGGALSIVTRLFIAFLLSRWQRRQAEDGSPLMTAGSQAVETGDDSTR
ncbi:MAG: CHASE3 domain-containing protein [Nitrospirota bacterium]|nr:CHASE3 domain-containing protein [Nitrospirota bacterium]